MDRRCLPLKEEQLSHVELELQVVGRHPLRDVNQTGRDLFTQNRTLRDPSINNSFTPSYLVSAALEVGTGKVQSLRLPVLGGWRGGSSGSPGQTLLKGPAG